MRYAAAGFDFRDEGCVRTDQLPHFPHIIRAICEGEREPADSHFPTALDGFAVFDCYGRELDLTTDVAGLVAADPTAFADTQHNSVALNFHDLSRNGVEVDVDKIAEL